MAFDSTVCAQVLISRNYRGDIEPSVIDKFMPLLMEREEEGNMSPIIQVTALQGELYLLQVTVFSDRLVCSHGMARS